MTDSTPRGRWNPERAWLVSIGLGLAGTGCSMEPGPGAEIVAVDIEPASVQLETLSDSIQLSISVKNADGNPVETWAVAWRSENPAVARVEGIGLVRAASNGSTHIFALASNGISDSVLVTVAQAAESLAVVFTDSSPVLLLPVGASLPFTCSAVDRAGHPLPPPMVSSTRGTVSGTNCDDLAVIQSGLDTLIIQAGGKQRTEPFAVAVPPVSSSPGGVPLPADSVPANLLPWAPTLVRSSHGELHLYFGNYFPDSTSPIMKRGDLARYVSSDHGSTFRYDGVMIHRDSIPCSPRGDGIENIAIAPRAEAGGWRMFYASGGFTCYGWQVFSAVSTDQRNWTLEAGVRVGNGGSFPPDPPVPQRWPTGEGMLVDRLPSGEWRMIMGSYEPLVPTIEKFQITEWRSSDQISWSYTRTLLKTDDVGPGAQRSIYSPTIREFTPGLYRMIFTGDDRDVPGGLSRLYSAVSLDMVRWHVEGVLLSSPVSNFFYSSLVDDLLVFIRQDPGLTHYLAVATVTMP